MLLLLHKKSQWTHKTVYHLGGQRASVANIPGLSKLSDWLHTSQGVWACLHVYVCEGEAFSMLPGDNEITHKSFDVIGREAVREAGRQTCGRRRGHRSPAGKQEGRRGSWGLRFPPPVGGLALIMNGRSSRRGGTGSCLLFEKPPSLFLADFLRSPCLHVIRAPAGRMISCQPQWWPSTA